MNDLLETVIEAPGGLERWNQLDDVSARLLQDGALWWLKGQAGVLDDVVVTASLHKRVGVTPRSPDGGSLPEPLIVSIDLSEIAFT